MQLLTSIVALLVFPAPRFGGPSAQIKPIAKCGGNTEPNSYIVKLKDGVLKNAHFQRLASTYLPHVEITHRGWHDDVFHGYAGIFEASALNALRANSEIESIEENCVAHITTTITQVNETWGLQRMNQVAPLASKSDPNDMNYTYRYDSSAGQGVDIYIIDTGIYIAHREFAGRAKWGATFGKYANADGHGHGTHCAGTAAGTKFGVAKLASLIAVKVLSDYGSGTVSDIISGLDYVSTQAASTHRPSIASMSLSGPPSAALDSAVSSLIKQGIHVVVAAGNDDNNASIGSPGRVQQAITVGASDIKDTRASFSNYGAVLDIFAPGVNVISSWISGPNSTNALSGTSMSTPHITGLVATILGREGLLPPASMADRIKDLATKDALKDIPNGTVNLLARTED